MPSIISASTTSGTALTFTADTSGVLALQTGATPTTAVTIDTSQNVGIGTSSPATKIEITNGKLQVNTGSSLGFAGTGGINLFSGTGAEIRLYDNSNSCGINTVPSGGASSLAFSTSGTTERMRITSAGNVGIGTDSPVNATNQRSVTINGTSVARVDLFTGGTNRFNITATSTETNYANEGLTPHAWYSNGSERMRISSGGLVGIGTSAPTSRLTVGNAGSLWNTFYATANSVVVITTGDGGQNNTSVQISGGLYQQANTTFLDIIHGGKNNNVGDGWRVLAGCGTNEGTNNSYYSVSSIASNGTSLVPTERMRITSGGDLLVGSTSATWAPSGGGAIQFKGFTSHAGISGAYQANGFNLQWNGSAARLWVDASDLGSITTSSDYRIKRNIKTQTAPALERVMALRPVTYQMADYGDLFKATEEIKEGFIAHEVQEVIPSGAEGEKDAENQIQSLRVDAILAVAVKAIQELKAELDATKAEVAALKGAK